MCKWHWMGLRGHTRNMKKWLWFRWYFKGSAESTFGSADSIVDQMWSSLSCSVPLQPIFLFLRVSLKRNPLWSHFTRTVGTRLSYHINWTYIHRWFGWNMVGNFSTVRDSCKWYSYLHIACIPEWCCCILILDCTLSKLHWFWEFPWRSHTFR